MSVSRNLAKSRRLPLAAKNLLQEKVLGPHYDLSVAWVSPARIQELNYLYRGKDKATNILSFPLSSTEGEILFCAELIQPNEVIPLFIHGLLHLKGMRHGSRMENEERKLVNFFTTHASPYRRRS